ncbi:MAG: hypothetical protein EXR72_13670 [Myxococcales bacterium]|nr:hypothetical protein [Myxococcales bacterium]
MKGFVPTPESIVDAMVAKLFHDRPPAQDSRILDPGCGPGAFIDGIFRWCAARPCPPPQIVGIKLDPARHATATARFASDPGVRIVLRDFLIGRHDRFDYVIGNPPYVPITSLSRTEKTSYRTTFQAARGRFDLYLLFFEQAYRTRWHL